jgi:hypothetical protein
VQEKLKEVMADPRLTITMEKMRGPVAKAPPLTPQILGPVERLSALYFPGVPLVPTMSTGATDGIFLEAVGFLLRPAGRLWRSRWQWGAWAQ